MDEVTPEMAVRKAVWMVQVPSMSMLFGPLLVGMLLIKLGVLPGEGAASAAWVVPLCVGAIAAGWLIWAIQVPRWRLWTYENVEDARTAERLAAARGIIWREGSIFEKTEIASSQSREKLDYLRKSKMRRLSRRGPRA